MKYESFFEKKLQICAFFCNFVPILCIFELQKGVFMVKALIYRRLYEWYEINHRILPWRDTDDAYRIWLSEVILQQTRVAQGLDYYMRFVARWPHVEDLAAADEAEVLREWQGLGYYSRARNLHKAAQQIVESQKSKVESGEQSAYFFPKTYEDIRQLPGVGDYTAGAIASFAYDLPYPAMDGNVYRVIARLMDIDEAFDTNSGKKLFRQKIEELLDREHPRLFNSAIMEFGAIQCTPVIGDNCLTCPLQSVCASYAHGTAELLPVRKARPKVRDRWFTYHIYVKKPPVSSQPSDVFTLLQRRENPKDIWYHLYEFPCEETQGERLKVKGERVISFTHVLSHQKIHARFLVHPVEELPDISGAFCVSWKELDNFVLSRLTLRVLDLIFPQ